MRKLWLFFFVTILLADPGWSQSLHFIKYNVENGLNQSNITSVVQDKYGKIWIGSFQGLNSYDGYTFEEYRPVPGDNKSIQINVIRSLFADCDGNIWAGHTCLSKYDNATGSFSTYYGRNVFFEINKIVQDSRKNLWLARSNLGLAVFNTATKKMADIDSDSVKINVVSILIDKQNKLWKLSNNNEISFTALDDFYKKNITEFRSVYKAGIPDLKLFVFEDDSHGRIWTGTNKGLYLLDKKTGEFSQADGAFPQLSVIGKDPVSCLTKDKSGRIWCATSKDRIFYLTFVADGSVNINEIIPLNIDFKDKSILSLFTDDFEVLWISSDNGLFKADLNEKQFSVLPGNNLYPRTSIFSLFEDEQKNLYISSKLSGITIIDARREKSITMQHDPVNLSRFMISNRFLCMLQFDKNYIMCGGNGLYKADFINSVYQYSFCVKEDTTTLSEWVIWSINKGKKSGKIWVGTHNGFCGINDRISYPDLPAIPNVTQPMPYKFIRYNKKKFGKNYPGPITWAVFEDHEGIVWVGSDNGLGRYNPETNTMKMYNKDRDDSTTLSSIAISTILEDSKNRLWFGTEGGGINLFSREKETFSHFNEKDGLSSNIVWGILEDNKGNLWISTTRGLTKFNPETKAIRNYFASDGLQSNEFNRGAYNKTSDGKMLFGGVNGINEFYPDSIKDNPFPPKILISSIDLFDEPVKVGEEINGDVILGKSVFETNEISLSHKNNILSIYFIAIHYAIPEKNRCAYMLEGFDKKWITTSSQKGMAHYTNLSAGTYRFRVKASNCDGLWSEEKVLVLHVMPPFWQTWWFISLMIILIISVSVGYYNYRVFKIRQKNIELEKMVKERTSEIEQQKVEISAQAENMQQINVQLKERQEELEVATEELRTQSEDLYTANGELLKLNATKDKFFNIIAHDLKNPFQAILGFSDMLNVQYDIIDDQQIKSYITAISNSSKSAYSLLENLLEWARSQTNRIRFEPVSVKIKEIADTTFQLLKLNAENKNIELVAEVQADAEVFADKNMITTVIRNLVNNAIKFTRQGGKITLRCDIADHYTVVSIADTGVGMSQESIDKLFRIDKASSTTGTSGEAGTGLGLIICKEFIDKNNGEIKVTSKEGEGTCFSIYLPKDQAGFENIRIIRKSVDVPEPQSEVEAQEDDEQIILSPENSRMFEGENISILVIDDNNDIRQNVVRVFPNVFTVFEAKDGEEGLNKAFEILPDLVVSDVMMPKMDGFEVCRRLKTDERTSHIPVILLTAKTSDSSKMTGLETGADDYLTKPFNPLLLLMRAKNLIESRKKLSERFSKKILLKPSDIAINSTDEQFITRALKSVEDNISDSNYGVDQFVEAMAIGRTQLYKKIKSLTNQPINDFIRSIRLKRSAQLLLQKNKTIAEIAYETGFNYPEYFTKCFKKEFGVLPTEFAEKSGGQSGNK